MPEPKKEDIFEESTYKVIATIKSGMFSTKYKGKLDLVYKSGDETLHTDADLDVNKGKVEKDYPVPKVKDTDDNYVLKIIAKYGKNKEKTLVLTEATVWPKSVKVTVKDTENKPLKEVPFYVEHDGDIRVNGNTDDNGVGIGKLRKMPHTVGIKAPWEIVSDKNSPKKREHEIVVRRNMEAKILKPDLTKDWWVAATGTDKKAGVRQYVNAPATGENGCDGNGSILEFEVACKKLPDGQKNDKIYIKVEFSKLSKRNSPVPALLAPALGITSSNGGKTLTGHVMLPSDGGKAKFKLQLGYAGGETFKVSCGYSKKDPSDDSQTFVTWRKITYQLRFPSVMKARMTEKTRLDGTKYFDIPDAVYNVVKTRLDAVWVEYANVKSHEFTPPDGSPCLVTRGYLEDSNDATPVYVIDEDLVWLGAGAPAFDASADMRESRITFCDAALDEDTKDLNPTISLTAKETDNVEIDTDDDYKYFVKKPFKPDKVNLKVSGYKWKADLSKVAANDKKVKPGIEIAFTTADYDDWNEFQIEEPTAGGGSLTLCFDDTDELSTGDKAKLKTYYENCFLKREAIRKSGNKLKFAIRGSASDDGDAKRQSAIKTELNSIHSGSAKRLLHPGLTDDEKPLEGEMSEVEITQVTSRKMKFKLPVRDKETDPLKPGDIAGAASATKCPINVTFSITGAYTYNGHAGGGEQVLVLRNVIPEAIAATVCHELGHAMGMAVMPLTDGTAMPMPPGLTLPDHVDAGGTYYRNRSSAPYTDGFRKRHQGPHCCEGMPASKKAHKSFKDWSTSGAAKICIMWGEGGNTDDRTQYCATCTEVLKARDLRDIRKTWAGSAEG